MFKLVGGKEIFTERPCLHVRVLCLLSSVHLIFVARLEKTMFVNWVYTATLLISIVALRVIVTRAAEDDIDTDVVDCPDQQEACKCRKTAMACQFRLDIEELQTFTSYKTNADGDIVSRGTPGDTYFMTEKGFVPSIGPTSEMIPEQGPCWNDSTLRSDTDFNNMGCSIPMMVDGRSYREFIAVNGRIPGPTLIVYKDQYVIIDVFNHLTNEGVTIHWHGIHQKRTPWMDGVAAVSQAPIVPGGQFRYIFEANPSGTHWYHSHLGSQRTDGLFGALIVHESDQEYQDIIADVHEDIPGNQFMDLPDMHTITLLDWQREASINLFVKIHSTLGFYPQLCPTSLPENSDTLYYPRTTSTDGIEVGPVPYWSGLINGKGRYNATDLGVLSIFNVSLSISYRFRIIGAQSLYAYKFEIEDHRLRVIATDGQIVHLTGPLDYIIVHSGERYDFILDTKEEIQPGSSGNYWIRAETLEVSNTLNDGRPVHAAEAVLHYTAPGALNPNPLTRYDNVRSRPRLCTQQAKCIALNCPFKKFPSDYNIDCMVVSQLRNRFSDKLPRIDNMDSDNLKFFNFGFEGQSFTSAINGRNFLSPPSPYQTYRGEYDRDVNDNRTCQSCNSETTRTSQPNQCTCTYVERIVSRYKLSDGNDHSVMFVLSAVGFDTNRDFSHPVHLHGHSFYVVHVGYGTYSNGVLQNNSMDVECDTGLCMNPRWRNGTPAAVKKAMSSTGLLIDTAVRKDTVIVPAGGYVVIAFVADNPGYWYMHCHIEVHQLEGMAVIIQEYDETEHNYDLPKDINKPGKFNWSVSYLSGADQNLQSSTAALLSIFLFMSFMITAGY